MGFTPNASIYTIRFGDDTRWSGFECRIHGCTVREWNELMRLGGTQPDISGVADVNEKTIEFLVEKMVSWNVEIPEGNPVPISAENIGMLDQGMLAAIMFFWQRKMTDISADLGKGSTNGVLTEEASLGLAATSQSLQNWPKPSGMSD